MQRIEATNATELAKLRAEHESNGKSVIVLFTGTKNANGRSWCPDCVVAEPVVEKVIGQLKDDASLTFITAPVGNMQR